MTTRVIHCKHEPYDIYIGRPSKWGNPFKVTKSRSRERAIREYRDWLNGDTYLRKSLSALHYDGDPPSVREIVEELHGKILGCWCKPKACHGDVLQEFAEGAIRK